jgi:hypothetical protein
VMGGGELRGSEMSYVTYGSMTWDESGVLRREDEGSNEW